MQAEKKGVSSLLVGIIIGCAPLSLVILSPILGYLVSDNGANILQVLSVIK